MIDQNNDEQTLAFRFAGVALPTDAIDCGPWKWHGGHDWRRHFLTREWNVAGIWISVAGEQDHHGHLTRWVHVEGEDHCTRTERHTLIAALIEADRLLDTLT